ncbi:SirA family protein [Allomeiothermus silvanus DSM 9946]|uniref:SirA family protein n=1 Tax=Allomeiothermus silvanus (strain ATCC 700542 / DSM 9946 / NBRC 106475 / NCIMB 13440 / VI-R2) TaxID=526227 RepID=D7BGV7_ALLS1|nr:sulfurtransferase TusA family protein [Allomeiothermus silvanus]ADH62111.1 SirA family protein [Allomeiothermus silvanus DSM 9946]
MSNPVQISKEIDARGSFCPGPLMELIRAVKAANVGEVITVLSGDPGSVKDIPAWVTKAGHEFLGMEDAEGEVKRFIVRKAR